jgi:hypothetical protein
MTTLPNDAALELIAQAWEIEDPDAVPNLAEFIDPQLFYPPEDPFMVEAMMPIAALYGSEDMDEAKLASNNRTLEAEKARFEGIRQWMRQMGPEVALRAAPIIAAVDDKLEFSCADGWHRCVGAQKDFGIEEVPVVVVCPGNTIHQIWRMFPEESEATVEI